MDHPLAHTTITMVMCCHCGSMINERDISGTFLNRKCPSCGKALKAQDYDKLAHETISLIRKNLAKSSETYLLIKEIEETNEILLRRINALDQVIENTDLHIPHISITMAPCRRFECEAPSEKARDLSSLEENGIEAVAALPYDDHNPMVLAMRKALKKAHPKAPADALSTCAPHMSKPLSESRTRKEPLATSIGLRVDDSTLLALSAIGFDELTDAADNANVRGGKAGGGGSGKASSNGKANASSGNVDISQAVLLSKLRSKEQELDQERKKNKKLNASVSEAVKRATRELRKELDNMKNEEEKRMHALEATLREQSQAQIEQAKSHFESALEAQRASYEARVKQLEDQCQAERDLRLVAEGPHQVLGRHNEARRRRMLLANEVESSVEDVRVLYKRVESLSQQMGSLREELDNIALNRYYTCEWFRMTRFPLASSDLYGKPFALKPNYNLDNEHFTLAPDGQSISTLARSWGQYGEFLAFDRLCAAAANPNSPLYGARILPNLVFSWREPVDGLTLWGQVDCLVLTTSFAAVIEVKCWGSTSVKVAVPFNVAKIKGKNENVCAFLPSEGKDGFSSVFFGQSKRAKEAIASMTDAYDERRTLNATVFVDPDAFETSCDDFCDSSFIGWLSANGGNLIGALERQARELSPVMSKPQLDKLADDVFEHTNDIEGRRSHARFCWENGNISDFFNEWDYSVRFGWKSKVR